MKATSPIELLLNRPYLTRLDHILKVLSASSQFQPALINYLAFAQLEDAHAHAYQANKHALSAIRYARDSLYAAVGAIIISIILGIISLFNSPELDVTQ